MMSNGIFCFLFPTLHMLFLVDFSPQHQLSIQQPSLPPVLVCTCLSHIQMRRTIPKRRDGSFSLLEILCLKYFVVVFSFLMLCHTGDPWSSFRWIIYPGLSPPLWFPADNLPIYRRGSVITPQVHALALCAFKLLPISTTPALKVIQHFPCNVPAFFTTDAIPTAVISRLHGTELLEMRSVKVKSQTQCWVNISKRTAPVLFSLFSTGVFCLAGFLSLRQTIISVHLVGCSSMLWCDTAKCVKYGKPLQSQKRR